MESSAALSGLMLALRTVGGPALACLVVWALARRPLPTQAAPLGALAGLLLGWALGFGHQAAFPPAQTLDWLPWLLLALGLAGLVPGNGAWARIAVLIAGLWLLAPPLLREAETVPLALELGGAGALGVMLMLAAGRSANPGRGAIALAAGLGSLGFVTSLGGSIVIGGLANSAFAVAAVLWLGSLAVNRYPAAGSGLLQAGAAVWLWLAFSARHLAEIHLPETLLAATAIATTLLASPAPEARGLRRLLGQALPPAIPALTAVGLAVWRYLAAQHSGYY